MGKNHRKVFRKANRSRNLSPISSYQGDFRLLSTYRMLLIMNRIANLVYGNIWVAYHIGALLAINVVAGFAALRWSHLLSPVSLMLLGFGGTMCVFVMFMEVLALSCLPDKANEFLIVISKNNVRKSVISKTVRSCWKLKLEVGKPFFTISHFSFLLYLQQLSSFFTTLLLSVEWMKRNVYYWLFSEKIIKLLCFAVLSKDRILKRYFTSKRPFIIQILN